MLKKILFIPDWHWREKDFRSIGGYVDLLYDSVDQIRDIIVSQKINYLVFLGDVFDGGYSDIGTYQSHINLLAGLVDLVNGEAYLNIGNHFFKQKQKNPEVYAIQPTSIPNVEYRPDKRFMPRPEPILRVVQNLVVDSVQIAFHHFNEADKNYVTRRNYDVDYVVGVYHDDCTVPRTILDKLNLDVYSTNAYLERIYSGVDLAIHGHIHVPFPIMKYGQTHVLIPGALLPTSNSAPYKHSAIQLPIISVDGPNYALSYVRYETRLDKLQFFDIKERSIEKETRILRKAASQNIGNGRFVTLAEYINKKGHNKSLLEIADLASKGALTMENVIDVIRRDQSGNVK